MSEEYSEEYPVSVTLHFKNERERDFFMAGLSDGWGEDACSLQWPYEGYTEEYVRSGKAFAEQTDFDVTVFGLGALRRRELIRKQFSEGLTAEEQAEWNRREENEDWEDEEETREE